MWSDRLQELRDRCTAVDRLVDAQAAELAQATTRYLAMRDSPEAYRELEGAEQLYSLALHSQRQARRARGRAEARHAVLAMIQRLARLAG